MSVALALVSFHIYWWQDIVAVCCCSVLQSIAVRCSVFLQCVAVSCCSALQCVEVCCSFCSLPKIFWYLLYVSFHMYWRHSCCCSLLLQSVAVYCGLLQCVACRVLLQCCCSVLLQCVVAVCYRVLSVCALPKCLWLFHNSLFICHQKHPRTSP